MSRLCPLEPLRGMRLAILAFVAACHGTNGNVLTGPDGSSMSDTPIATGPWTDVSTGGGAIDFYSVWAGAANNVLAVGVNTGDSLWPGMIMRFDGTSWAPTPYGINLYGVFARTAVGELGSEGSFTFWNGAMWTQRQVLAPGTLNGTWETSPGTYAVGQNGRLFYTSETGIAGSWGTLTSNTNETLYAVWGATSSDVYAVGARGAIVHNPNAGPGVTGPWNNQSFGFSTLRAIWGSSPDDIYVVGEAPAVILHTTDRGMTWTQATLPASAIGLYGIAGTSANDIYVVGATGGLAFHSTGNNVWTTEQLPTTKDLFGISIAPSGDIYAVGRGGTIFHKAP